VRQGHDPVVDPAVLDTDPAPIDTPTPPRKETIRITTSTAGLSATLGAARRPTPYETALAAVAHPGVHIERVWPMCSPSTESLEAFSSAYFHPDPTGTPPPRINPVVGLQMNQPFTHQPVMATEVVELLAPVPPGLVVDATLGGAGHAAAILEAHPHLQLLGIDRDPAAVEAAAAELARFGDRAIVRRSRFDELAAVVRQVQTELGTPPEALGLSGVLFDLGVSSPQLDVAERGFSYRRDAPLDMRMDPTSGRTAADVVNQFDEGALVSLFLDNGEGRFARRIARAIVSARPIATTGELADVVRTAIPAATRRSGGHPARRVFQAIRIAVNEELDQLDRALGDALGLLRPGGRCVVIAYHSGEDRLVKSSFVQASTGGCTCPPGLPCVCGAVVDYRLVARGSRRPTTEEIDRNRRSEAARLRVIERLAAPQTRSVANGEVA
jgi:16S rRNA (cytosine1402-N4)-methyltransferase